MEISEKLKARLRELKTENRELKARIGGLEQESERLISESQARTQAAIDDFRLKTLLEKAGAKNVKLLTPALLEKLKDSERDEDGSIKNLENEINSLKNSADFSFCFEQELLPRENILASGYMPGVNCEVSESDCLQKSPNIYSAIEKVLKV